MFATYKPSGRFAITAIPLLLVGMIAAIAIAFVYKFLLDWIPLIYVNFLMTAGVGLAFGFIGALIVKFGHVRNPMLAILFGVLMTVAGLGGKYYFQYTSAKEAYKTAFVDLLEQQGQDARVDRKELEKFKNEQLAEIDKTYTFSKHIGDRVKEGWSIGRGGNGAPISGIFVYLIWLTELVIIAGASVFVTTAAAGEPYSEELGAWASEEEVVMNLPVTNADMVRQIESATTVDDLLAIPIPETDESSQFAVYKVNSIEGADKEDAYLSVDLLTISLNSDGEQETNTAHLVKYAILSAEQRAQLVENAELMNEAFADYRAAIEAEQAALPPATDGAAEVSDAPEGLDGPSKPV